MKSRRLARRCALAVATFGVAQLLVATPSPAVREALTSAAPSPKAAAQLTFYASPTGTGTKCVDRQPCALTTAQSRARAAMPGAGADVVVLLRGGTYQVSTPLSFTSADSGRNGHTMRYQAVAGQTPVISGGRTIAGWTRYSGSIWRASAPGILPSRQLYVNGTRAALAGAPASSVFGSLSLLPDGSGYAATQAVGLSGWSDPADQPDLLFAGKPFAWAMSVCGIVAPPSAAPITVKMATPCIQNLASPLSGYRLPAGQLDTPTRVENNLGLLTAPGQFFVSSHDGAVYYIPRAGENLATATVVVPQASALVVATGVSDLALSGITFSYATWRADPGQGVVDVQSNLLTGSGNTDIYMLPSALQFTGARHVTFSDNSVTHLGGGGVSFAEGGSGNVVSGNLVSDISSTGISIGDGVGYAAPTHAPEIGDTVTNNSVHDAAREYQGGVGIFAGWVSGTTISHNEVGYVSGNGVALGWGWGNSPGVIGGNHIDFNHVHDVNSSTLSDGGALYVLGASTSSTIIGNYLDGDPQPFGELYLDAGAANYHVANNVVARSATNWIYLQTAAYGVPATHNYVANNYADTAMAQCLSLSAPGCASMPIVDASNTFTGNQVGLTSWPGPAQSVMAAAGPSYGVG